jgi:hypothetical protein
MENSMELFQQMVEMGHERVLVCSNPDAGLQAIIAVHSGSAARGCGPMPARTKR